MSEEGGRRNDTSRGHAPAPGAQGADLRTEIAPRPPQVLPEGTYARTEIASGPPDMNQAPADLHRTPAAAVEPAQLAQGVRCKQFELIRELGRGGMGQVWLARDTRLGRLVALKFLQLRSPELKDRFLIEARATARCQHENIVVIYEADEWEGHPYMALEYLEGESLADAIRHRIVSPRRAVEIVVPVVRALARAHDFNIVHRDLKPDNIFVTREGVVKVLDFGIAKLFETGEAVTPMSPEQLAGLRASRKTQEGGIVGTMPYMSPEQWGAASIDHRTDFWALGIILWEMLTRRHPLAPLTPERLCRAAVDIDQPVVGIGAVLPEIPAGLEQIVDRCLAKRKEHRFESARELLDALEQLLPGRFGRRLEEGESPYPGLSAFQESDADRFFGRDRDVTQMVQRVREQPLIGVVGASGVGKSSFVRAGVVPAMRASGEEWEIFITRPGRDPIAGLASLLQPMASTGSSDARTKLAEHAALVTRLRAEPGYLGAVLRSRARQKNSHILLFVDQFEELYTLVDDPDAREAFTASLVGMADDAAVPLRVVVSMRSDFLDRAAEDRAFMAQLTRGLMFLPPIDREGMREALIQPLDMVGYRFESEAIVSDMLDALADTPGALPLLQFTAAKLWDVRDRGQRLLTEASYQALGGLAGALATHADEVLTGLSSEQQRLVRAMFRRLVTSDGTRALVDVTELRQLSTAVGDVQALVDYLVGARLLVVQSRGELEGPAVEIVHESLITSWPTLRRWLEESHEDTAFLEQLRGVAKQWDGRGRPVGLLWRGEAMEEARRFRRRYQGELAARERDFLDAVLELETRSVRRRRRVVVAAFVVLLGLVAAAAVALIWISEAQREAEAQRELAESQTAVARDEADKARTAEAETRKALATIKQQMETIEQREAERDAAQTAAAVAEKKAESGEKKLAMTYAELEAALAKARREKSRAESATTEALDAKRAAEKARAETERLLAKEREKRMKAEEEKRRLATKLK